jgi:hypothetical protein
VLVWAGDPAEGRKAMAPLRRIGRPIADLVRPAPYLLLQSMLDAGNPHGRQYYWRSQRVRDLSDDVIDVLVARADAITSPLSHVVGFAIGGAAARVAAEATAVGERHVGFELNIVAAWPAPDPNGERHTAWVRGGWEALRPHNTGVSAHFLSDEGAAGVEAAYGQRLQRLTTLKDRDDRPTASA